jgi:hypothetical protein
LHSGESIDRDAVLSLELEVVMAKKSTSVDKAIDIWSFAKLARGRRGL